MSKLAIIDGDSICFLCSKDTIQESIENVDSIIMDILETTGSTHYYLFLSKGMYFRHTINPLYKAKRGKSPLRYLKTLKSYLIEQYNAEFLSNVEADDAVAYAQQKYSAENESEFTSTIICAIDKDVTKGIAGHHFNYRTHEFSHTSTTQANLFLHIQAIMGDSTDNITGIPGTGEVKARKLLIDALPENYATIALQAYIDHYKCPIQGAYEYQKNLRQVYLLRTDEDFQREVGYLPDLQPPVQIIN